MEYIALEVFNLGDSTGSQYAVLPEDTTITITDTSEIFASGDVWSHSFTLNVAANAHLFGTAGDIHGSRLHEQIDKRKARLWVKGIPLYLGYLKLDSEAEVDAEGNVDVSFESGQKTFEEMIEGAKANQVPMMGDVQIGMAQWRKRKVQYWLELSASAVFDDGSTSDPVDIIGDGREHEHSTKAVSFDAEGENEQEAVQQYPRMVYPQGTFKNLLTGETASYNFINTDTPYDDGHPYCNIALCYQRYGYEKQTENGSLVPDYTSEPEAQRGYEYMPANRVNSAPCFFVLYWLKALMSHLGIHIEENQMADVQDFRRLFFVNSKCDYEEPQTLRTGSDSRYGKYIYGEQESQFVITRIIPEQVDKTLVKSLTKTEDCGFTAQCKIGEPSYDTTIILPSEVPTIEKVNVHVKSIDELSSDDITNYTRDNQYLHNAFATSECFPNADISEVIHALESGFGVRFLFSDNYRKVRILLLRNIFRSEATQVVPCDIVNDVKVENNIRGFRMTYGNTEDTHFYYKGFADLLQHQAELWPDTSDKHDYSKWMLDASYQDVINKISAFDKTCYVTPATGDAHIIKIDKDAKRYKDTRPSLFECAPFMDAEDGDCTGDDETIETVNMGFTPAIMNDLNMEEERSGTAEQRFALFVDETMRPRRPDLQDGQDYNNPDAIYSIAEMNEKYGAGSANPKVNGSVVAPGEFSLTSDMHATKQGLAVTIQKLIKRVPSTSGILYPYYARWDVTMDIDGHINEGYRLYLQDNYEPNDDGVSPIETHDWGLMLGIMRGSGSDARVSYWGDVDDQEGNDTWEIVPGSSVTAHPDTCDHYGRHWDYTPAVRIDSAATAIRELEMLYAANGNAAFFEMNGRGYVNGASVYTLLPNTEGTTHRVTLASSYSRTGKTMPDFRSFAEYYNMLCNARNADEILELDRRGYHDLKNLVIEVDGSQERCDTFLKLCRIAYGGSQEFFSIENGIGYAFGRVSLKPRAEKLNPYFDKTQPESNDNRRYLQITDEDLCNRGLADQFYKEYSYWVRNARIAQRNVIIELAQLLSIDKTKRVTVGDITGFIRKMQYTVSNKTGLGPVTMDLMYI